VDQQRTSIPGKMWWIAVAIPAQSGTVTVGGFTPDTAYTLTWWNTYTGSTTTTATTSNAQGTITLAINNLDKDTAVAITSSS
jgi:hypothetical protein